MGHNTSVDEISLYLPSLKASILHDPENLSWAAVQNGTSCANIYNGKETPCETYALTCTLL